MTAITLQLRFERADGTVESHEYRADTPTEPAPRAEKSLADELADHLRTELTIPSHLAQLPRADKLANPSKRTIRPTSPTDIHDALNTEGLWLEIQNTLYATQNSIAEAKAYKDIEPSGVPIEQWYPAHAKKLSALNAGVLHLAKIQDLVVRLLFESFGGSQFIVVDLSDDDWEKALTMKSARRSLDRLRDTGSLDAHEHAQITAALDQPSRCPQQKRVIEYRNCVVHRIRPSIDHPELSPVLQDRLGRPVYDQQGKQTGICYPILATSKADFQFDELYQAITSYLGYVVRMS
jgi:hypothetical protein